MNYRQRCRARLLITRVQHFADEPLTAVANFTWVGNGTGARAEWLGREDLAGGLPMWTLIGAGTTRLFIVEADTTDPDRGERLVGSWPLDQVWLDEESNGPAADRSIRFTFPGRRSGVLQSYGCEVEDLLAAHRAAQPNTARWGLAQVSLMTTSHDEDDDAYFLLSHRDGRTTAIPLRQAEDLLADLQDLPGFDNEEFIRAVAVTEQGVAVLWRAVAV